MGAILLLDTKSDLLTQLRYKCQLGTKSMKCLHGEVYSEVSLKSLCYKYLNIILTPQVPQLNLL